HPVDRVPATATHADHHHQRILSTFIELEGDSARIPRLHHLVGTIVGMPKGFFTLFFRCEAARVPRGPPATDSGGSGTACSTRGGPRRAPTARPPRSPRRTARSGSPRTSGRRRPS